MFSPGNSIKPQGGKLAFLSRVFDGLLIFVALQICGRLFHVDVQGPYYWFAIAWAEILFLLIAETRSLYQSWWLVPISREAGQVGLTWLVVFVLLVVLAFSTKTSAIYSRLVIFSWALLTPSMLVLARAILRICLRELGKRGNNTRTLVIAGASVSAQKLISQIRQNPWLGFKIIGVYDDDPDAASRISGLEPLQLQGDLRRMVQDVRAEGIDIVYITLPMHPEDRIVRLIDDLADTTASVYFIPDFFVFDLLHARWFNFGSLPIVSVFESPFLGVDGWLKRVEDVVLGSFILLVISPLLLAIALGVRLSSPGPIIFRQRRYGLNGQIVEVWKFRSMTVCEDGDHIPQARMRDSRITPLGALLRRTSLDELPQFFNVLQGSMSIVGPRPHAVAHNEQYRRLIHGYMLRHKVKPGITGWAQVNGWRGETDTLEKMEKRVEFDLAYMRNWSLWLDLKIIWLTIWKGFSGKSAY